MNCRQRLMWALLAWVVFVGAAGGLFAGAAERAAGDAQSDRRTQLDERLEPLLPKTERSEAEAERLEALSLFAAARALEQAEDFSGALRLYQRALRHDPDSLPIVQEIVQLAFSLGRPAEAVRYALKAIDLGAGDPVLLRRLAMHLTSQGDFAGALKLYDRALAQHDRNENSHTVLGLLAEMGELYLANGQHAEAAEAFARVSKALAELPTQKLDRRTRRLLLGDDPPEAYRRFGEAFLLSGRFDEAEAAFRKSHELEAEAPLLGLNLARVAAARGQPDEAVKRLEECLSGGAEALGAEPLELWVEQLAAAGEADQTLSRLEKMRETQPDNAVLGYFLAEQYLAAERFGEAEALFESMLAKEPAAEGFAGLFRLARVRRDVAAMIELLVRCGKQGGMLAALGDEADALTEDRVLARELFAAARKRSDDQADLDRSAQLFLAMLAMEGEEWQAAGEFFERAIAANPQQAALLYQQWGFGLLLVDRYDEAAVVFERAVNDPNVPRDDPDFHYHLAGALEMLGRTDEALQAARRAVALAEASADQLGDKVFRIYPRVAWILYHAGRYAEARTAYEDLISRFDTVRTSSEARDAVRDARFALSNICVVEKKLPEAEEWLQQILDEYPEDVAAYNDLGYLWADQGKNLERALEMIEQAVAEQPDNAAYRDSLGWVYFKLGRHAEAVVELEQAAAGEKPDGVILDHLADAYLAAGRTDDARAAYRRAIEALEAKQGDADLIKSIRGKLAPLE